MRADTYPTGPTYTGSVSQGGYIGPTISIVPGALITIYDRGIAWEIRAAPSESAAHGRRCLPIDIRPSGRRGGRFVPANALRE